MNTVTLGTGLESIMLYSEYYGVQVTEDAAREVRGLHLERIRVTPSGLKALEAMKQSMKPVAVRIHESVAGNFSEPVQCILTTLTWLGGSNVDLTCDLEFKVIKSVAFKPIEVNERTVGVRRPSVGDALRTMRDESKPITERVKAGAWLMERGYDTCPSVRDDAKALLQAVQSPIAVFSYAETDVVRAGWSPIDPDTAIGDELHRLADLTGIPQWEDETEDQYRARLTAGIATAKSRTANFTSKMSGQGTRSNVRSALYSVTGVTYAEVLDAGVCGQMKPGEVACIVAGGEPDSIAIALYEHAPCGLVWLGNQVMTCSTSDSSAEFRWHTPGSAPAHLLDVAIDAASGDRLDALGNALAEVASNRLDEGDLTLKRRPGEPDDEFRVRVKDPFAMEVDGMTLGDLLLADKLRRQEVRDTSFTPAQRPVVSAYHSQQLRERIAKADAEAKARAVTVCVQVDAEDLE